jgi:co-chaperonin GroES (HSP10)
MAVIKGKIVPIRDNILVTDMNFDARVTAGGIVLPSDDGKSEGIRHRWGRVWAIGPDQKDVKVGEWILIEHGRWTRTFEYENEDGSITNLQVADNKAIMLSADEKPEGAFNAVAARAGGNFNFNIPGL